MFKSLQGNVSTLASLCQAAGTSSATPRRRRVVSTVLALCVCMSMALATDRSARATIGGQGPSLLGYADPSANSRCGGDAHGREALPCPYVQPSGAGVEAVDEPRLEIPLPATQKPDAGPPTLTALVGFVEAFFDAVRSMAPERAPTYLALALQ